MALAKSAKMFLAANLPTPVIAYTIKIELVNYKNPLIYENPEKKCKKLNLSFSFPEIIRKPSYDIKLNVMTSKLF